MHREEDRTRLRVLVKRGDPKKLEGLAKAADTQVESLRDLFDY